MNESRDGTIVTKLFDSYTSADYAESFRKLADQIESGRVEINQLEVSKAGKGGPNWSVRINLSDVGETT